MRAVFGLISLLIVLLVVLGLAKKQLASTPAVPIHVQNPALVDPSVTLPVVPAGATPQAQRQQIEQQIKQSLDAAMQQSHPVPDDAK
ncbi:hypothetical protein RCH06_002426 [Polaromonas sp. CG_9.5]|uniref:hypothetical protein n=1 Tax=Polaromonas sp. CG_9.5 TaxID=3071705 RepID=UPI002E073EC3|nr:hypothetical protein [Polaromonas sp. CG_9.5]